MLYTLGYALAGALMLAVVASKTRALILDPKNVRVLGLAVAHFALTIAFVAAIPTNYEAIDRLTGVPNLATLVVYSGVTISLGAAVVCHHALEMPQRRARAAGRRQLVVTAAAVAAMAVLFTLADVHDASHPLDFDAHYALDPLAVAFQIAWWSAYSTNLVHLARVCRRTALASRLPWLRAGLGLVPIGCVIALGYTAGKAAQVAAAWAGADLTWVSTALAPGLATLGAVTMALGWSVPLVPRWALRVRTWRDLRPLYAALRVVNPALADNTPAVTVLYRRLIATNDLLRALRPHLDPEVDRFAHAEADRLGLDGRVRHAAIEAARIAAGLRAHAAGQTFDGTTMIREYQRADADPGQADMAAHGALLWRTARRSRLPARDGGPRPLRDRPRLAAAAPAGSRRAGPPCHQPPHRTRVTHA
ncbi:MAB_1171c family putative transporter [Saccharopolyspora erythraea]|uniref:MAB_1171c family putative transporter n=1 Tax=Saccharopolyspora erythraea TaxID=1836 RepID=UPI0001D30C47|nr:MAB_1171c family putative transporter [Saccharopolyspora erythraea]